jgi:hypothetical protein
MQALIERIGRSVGGVVGTLFQAGRDAVDLCLKTIIPFMAFVTFVIGLILETGVGDAIANGIKGFAKQFRRIDDSLHHMRNTCFITTTRTWCSNCSDRWCIDWY